MTSIPVRKGTVGLGGRRAAARNNSNEGNEKTDKMPEDKKRFSPAETRHHTKQLTHFSKKELLEENTQLRDDLEQKENQLTELRSSLETTKEQLLTSIEESKKVKEGCERVLLLSNIDPVTLENKTSDPDISMRQRREMSKERVLDLQSKLTSFNNQGSSILQNMKEVSSSLDELESLTNILPDHCASLNAL